MANCFSCLFSPKPKPKQTAIPKLKSKNEPDTHPILTNQEVYNRYQLFSKIGSGKISKSYLAVDEYGRRIALKVICKLKLPTAKFSESILNSNQRLRNLEHTNLMKLYKTIETATDIFIILEFAEKGNLETLLKNQARFPICFFKIVGAQIINALFFLHSHGITYGELNLKSIYLDAKGTVKLAEVCNFSGMSILDKNIEGTLNFIAPEILKGTPPNFSTDFFALGVVFYFIFYKRFPVFVRNKLVNFELENEEEDVRSLAQLLSDLLELNPKKRIGRNLRQFQTHSFFAGLNWQTPREDRGYQVWLKTLKGIKQSDCPEQQVDSRFNAECLFDQKDAELNFSFLGVDGHKTLSCENDFESTTHSHSARDFRRTKNGSKLRLSQGEL